MHVQAQMTLLMAMMTQTWMAVSACLMPRKVVSNIFLLDLLDNWLAEKGTVPGTVAVALELAIELLFKDKLANISLWMILVLVIRGQVTKYAEAWNAQDKLEFSLYQHDNLNCDLQKKFRGG